jgi:hypothetical protein
MESGHLAFSASLRLRVFALNYARLRSLQELLTSCMNSIIINATAPPNKGYVNNMNLRPTAPNLPVLRDAAAPPQVGTSRRRRPRMPDRQNAYIMRTLCAQKRECDIFNSSATITYNFDPLKCTHFLVGHSGNRQSTTLKSEINDPDESGRFQNTPFTTNVTIVTYKTGPSIRPDDYTVQNR